MIAPTSPRPRRRLVGLTLAPSGKPSRARRAELASPVALRRELRTKSCLRVVRIDGESSQFGTLRILPQTQRQISISDIHRDYGVPRIELLRSLIIGQRALPFTAAAVNRRAICSGQSIVRL